MRSFRVAFNLLLTTGYKNKFHSPSNYLKFSKMSNYVDVHAHLIHEQFFGEEDQIAENCRVAGLEYVICNGLEPKSNRATLDLCEKHSNLLPALGIYPLDAACNVLEAGVNWHNEFPPPAVFDVDSEIDFIDAMAAEKKIVAVGECGLDKHYVKDDVSMAEQERVLRKLMKVILLIPSS